MSSVSVANSSAVSGQRFGMGTSYPGTPPSTGYNRPLTGGRHTSLPEQLTPMPDYMRPVTKSASKRWKKLHEDHMMSKLMERRNTKKEKNIQTKEKARSMARKIPTEILAKQWLKHSQATVETRAFMVDKILPTLILGCEKLLMEVDRRELAESDKPDPNFNPINYLAKYLMQNNPRYSNFSEASPYIRGLREVGDDLREKLFEIEENKLAKIKAEARRKREEREREEMLRVKEVERRHAALQAQFPEWNVGLYPDGRVELALLQNALRSFAEICLQYPRELRDAARYSHELEATDATGKTLSLREFVQYLELFIENMPREIFDAFLSHLANCARTYRSQAERDQRKVVLNQLFFSCDHTGVGILDRHRVLNLFEMFYDKAQPYAKESLRNPRKWPVIEVQEMSDSLIDSEDEDSVSDKSFNEKEQDVSEDSKTSKQEVKEDTKQEPKEDTEEEQKDDTKQDQKEDVKAEAEEESPVVEKSADESQALVEEQTGVAPESTDAAEKPQSPSKEEEPEKQKGAVSGEAADEVVADSFIDDDEGKASEKSDLPEKTDSENETSEKHEEAKPASREAKSSLEDIKEEPDKEAAASNIPPETEVEDRGVGSAPVTDKDAERRLDSEQIDDVTIITEDKEEIEKELLELADGSLEQRSDDRPPMTQQSKVSFAEGTTFEKERTLLMSQGNRSHSQASAFDESTLNQSQFIHLTETFLGDLPRMEVFSHLVRYVREGYVETEDERMERLLKARREAQLAKRKALLNSLFEMWDNDGSGFIDLDEVETVMKKYKEGMESEAIVAAKKHLKKRSRYHDSRLSKREFRDFVHAVVAKMAGGSDSFDYFVEFLLNSVERSYTERVRGEARKKWLQHIITTAETSGGSMEPVYKSVFQALYKDAEAHGGGKIISANISMLEKNTVAPSRGTFLLRYTATTSEDAPYMLGKILYKDMKGISFTAIETGKPIHVPRVANHGNIYFWNSDRADDDKDGSFIVVPLKDRKKRVFGLLGIDTLNDPHSRAIFITHEIQFFQGVAKAFSIAYHHVDVRQKTMRISESAVSWIHRRCPHVHEVTVYMMEPEAKLQDYVLRKMMYTDHKANAIVIKVPPRLERKDNLFRDYLFKCVDNSESVTADAYGERHLAFPLRDDQGRAIVVIDVSIGAELKALPRLETKEIMKMLKLLQLAYKEITLESREGEKTTVLEGEKNDDENRTEILFDRLMLMELRENVSRLDAKAYAELKSYKEPPPVVHFILKAVLAVFYPEKATAGEFDDWNKCKTYVNPVLSQKILGFDPTGGSHVQVPVQLINGYFDDVPHGQVSKAGSIPAQFLYNWVFVCISMIEHTRKMQDNTIEADDESNPTGTNDGEADTVEEAQESNKNEGLEVDDEEKEVEGIDNEDTDVSEKMIQRRDGPRAVQVEVQEIPSDSEMDLDVGHIQKKQ